MTTGNMVVENCDIDQSVEGPNMRLSPGFASSVFGDCYLQSIESGYQSDSPCVNAFDGVDAEDFPGVNQRTTSPFQILDTDELDLGYHYFPDESYVTPTPTGNPTQTPLPTVTPTPTPDFELDLVLNDSMFSANESFDLRVDFSNWLDRDNPMRLFVILDVYGQLFYCPAWTEEVQFQYISLGIGQSGIQLLSFIWPDVSGSADELYFHAALMDTEGIDLISDPNFPELAVSTVSFGYN